MSTIELEHTLDEWAAGWSTQNIERVLSLCTDQCVTKTFHSLSATTESKN